MDHMSLCVEEAVHELASIFLESLESIGVSALGPRSPSSKSTDKDRDRNSRAEKDKDGPREKTPKQPDEKTIDEEIDELILYFNHRTFEALLRATRNALDGMKRRLFCTRCVIIIVRQCVTQLERCCVMDPRSCARSLVLEARKTFLSY